MARRRRRTGELLREARHGAGVFILACHLCGTQHPVTAVPIAWQCSECSAAHTVATATYVPHDAYFPPEDQVSA